jgi:hypothetical protein
LHRILCTISGSTPYISWNRLKERNSLFSSKSFIKNIPASHHL